MSEQTVWEKNLADDEFFQIHEDACCDSCGEGHCGQQSLLENGDSIFDICGCDCEESDLRKKLNLESFSTEDIVEEITVEA